MSQRIITPNSYMDRFWAKVVRDPDTDCWEWVGAKNSYGYGLIIVDGTQRQAHRISYEAHVGPIPDGLVIDHLCRVTTCVNPDHLEPVTHGENIRRGNNNHRFRTMCKYGHPLDGKNDRQRFCLTCRRTRNREWAQANRRKAA